MAPVDDSIANLTLAELALVLAPEIAGAAAFDGWSAAAVTAAAAEHGICEATAQLVYPGGTMDMIAAWIARIDADMAKALPAERIGNLPIRERIRALVQFRLDALGGREEALRRALAVMAMPQNLARAARLAWHSADAMWRLAGDTATDYNHYTKRATLGVLYTSTLLVLVDDTSEGKADTRAFLDRRIEGVMRFEKAKARLLRPQEDSFSMMRLLGRLRYPAR
jgi:ubiquinone biosynthesis protein COQ9